MDELTLRNTFETGLGKGETYIARRFRGDMSSSV